MNDSFQLPDYLKKDNIINNGFIHSMSLLNNVFIYPFFDYSDFDHITLVEISRDNLLVSTIWLNITQIFQ